jgi:two-component system, chemotaxis family, protein-glutamate methylesterase/glutaminase
MPPTSIVVIGASSGGVDALRVLASALPRAFPAPILIVLHVGTYPSELPALLNAVSSIPAKHAEDGEKMSGEQIYIAPPDRHLVLQEGRLRLTRSPKENWARPAIDPLFRSVARAYGTNAIGVILTGNLNDGTDGLLEIKRHGGIAIAQDPADAINPAMPSSAAAHVALDFCLPLAKIPQLLIELVDGKEGANLAMPITPSQPGKDNSAANMGERFDRPLTITCPECGGARRKSKRGRSSNSDVISDTRIRPRSWPWHNSKKWKKPFAPR